MRAGRCTTASSPVHDDGEGPFPQHEGGLHLLLERRRRWNWRCGGIGAQAFLRKLGQLDRLRTGLPESASPILPRHWGELNTVTITFGHGIAVAPLQAVMGIEYAGERRVL